MAKIFKTALLPVLLATTAASAADMAPQGTYVVQEDYNYFALGVTGGVTVLDLPDVQTGVFSSGEGSFDPDLDSLAIGATFGASMGASIGQVGDHTVFFGLSGFGSFATASGSATDSFTGRGLVVIPGYNVPADGTITLTTSRTPGTSTAAADVDHDNPQTGGATSNATTTTNTDPAGASASSVQPAGTGNSFSFAATNTQQAGGDQMASAYGAIADTSGSLFMGVGDLDGLTIDTTVSQEVIYAGADLTLGMGGPTGVPGNSFQAYAGPSYRYINQRNTTGISVDIPEVPGTTVVHPTYSLNRSETIESHYAGAVVGITTSQQFDRFTASLGLEGAAYYQMTSMVGAESVSIVGGSGVAGLPYALQTVPQDGISENAEGFAYAVRGQLGLSYAITNNLSIGVAGTAEYLSSVARLDTSTPLVSTDGDANASWVSGLADATPLIAFGEMWAFSGTASVVGRF